MIKITDIKKSFGKKLVLNNISLSLDDEIYGLLGPNGSGKTTLLRCLLSLYKYDGDVMFNQNKINPAQFGYLPQNFGLFPDLTVKQMMNYFAELKGIHEPQNDIENSLKKVGLLNEQDKRCKKLSGGMVRRLGIAQAILGDPPVMIFDEPTVGLDPEERLKFKGIIASYKKQNSTVLLSTHIIDDVDACCDKIIILNAGNIVAVDTPKAIAEAANGKVFVSPVNEFDKNNTYIIREYSESGIDMCRYLSKKQTGRSVLPTTEDGYLCLIKEF